MKLHNPFARHAGRHVLGPMCGDRGSSGTLYCAEPDGHIGPHIDSTEVGSIIWPRDERLAIEAPRRSWRRAVWTFPRRAAWWIADAGPALIDATARGMAWLIDGPEEVMPSDDACPNCGRPGYEGGVCGRCGWGYGYQPAHEAAVAAIYAPGELPMTPQDDDATDIISAVRVSARREARNIWPPPRELETWAQRTVAALMDEYFGGPVLKAITS